jgi:hypothetical protein
MPSYLCVQCGTQDAKTTVEPARCLNLPKYTSVRKMEWAKLDYSRNNERAWISSSLF